MEFEPLLAQNGALERLRRIARAMVAVWLRAANSPLLAFVVFGVIYVTPTVILAREKLLWDDEFFTLYLSSIRSWSELLAALSTGADQHPPSFYYLTNLILGTFGTTNVTLRLTAIIGYGVMCICLYEIVSRILSRPWGFAAMLLPLTCPVYYYSVEARGYGLQLGFVTLAFLAWMLAADGRHRWITLPLLAISTCGAVASHYYAVLTLIPLGVAELVRTCLRRKLDLQVWAALVAALIPPCAFMPTILSARSYSSHFWAVPHWRAMAGSYHRLTGQLILLLLGICAVNMFPNSIRHVESSALDRSMRSWQAVGFILLSSLPLLGMFVAKFLTHAYTERYIIAAIPGICVLLSVGLARMSRHSTQAAAALWALSLTGFGATGYAALRNHGVEYQELKTTATVLRKSGQAPIAIADVTVFHRLSFYAEPDLAQRLAYLSDPHASLRYLRHDTVDRGLLALNPWFPLNVQWLNAWLLTNSSFLMYASIGPWTWLPNALSDLKCDIRVLGVSNESLLLMSVGSVNVPPDDRVPDDPPGKPMLYLQKRNERKPLCEHYMQVGNCPNLN